MGKELNSIDDFYNYEKSSALIQAGLVMVISSVILILVSYIVLNMLIKRKITDPIDELAEVVEQVMEGNLDIEIPVVPGEQFEGLKRAFNEMIKSIRDVISKI